MLPRAVVISDPLLSFLVVLSPTVVDKPFAGCCIASGT